MLTGGGRIGPFLAVSLAVHGLVLLTMDTQRLSIAATPAGEGRTISVRLLAAGPPDPDTEPHGSQSAQVPEPEPGQSRKAARQRVRHPAPAARRPQRHHIAEPRQSVRE